MSFRIRELQLPHDYQQLAVLLSGYWSEPASAERLEEDDRKLYEVGSTWMDENGMLAGYDRSRRVAVNASNDIVGYIWVWRAPWTEPGYLCMTLVVDPGSREKGIGDALLRHAYDWAEQLGASSLMSEVWDDHPRALEFAKRRGFIIERHAYQSVLHLKDTSLELMEVEPEAILACNGLRLLTLADEPGEESERKLYELACATLRDVPSFLGDVPDFIEWKKWNLQVDGFAPELVLIAADGDRFVGMTNVLYIAATNGLYHEYTGVDRTYRGKKVGHALKLETIRVGKQRGADYIRTDNDSMNAPILAINRELGYVPLRGNYRIVASMEMVKEALNTNKLPQ
ncbi:GNAT family N-acetyltransferase [Paenibacillus sp. 1011MAR3C5]|uniref:GNAT family N-acetyltransferase n=1 Tax=Paenibacillus sp. 1011MAR3C5 TaxID=1675787 RepID=UPI000E6CBE8B|nr:GNAT family N-acetyltransferase [Paenibacillus sp. 1011MAR3C5]RJE86021.1 GNAT family N-acetyltransferase [Paenibacillus sp. 1011MAR3C5]